MTETNMQCKAGTSLQEIKNSQDSPTKLKNQLPRQSSPRSNAQLESETLQNSQHNHPLLLEIYADCQDKKKIFLSLTMAIILIGAFIVVAEVAVPNLYSKNNMQYALRDTSLSTCPNPSGISDQLVTCSNDPLSVADFAVGWRAANLIQWLYLQLRTNDLQKSITVKQSYSLEEYPLVFVMNENNKIDVYINRGKAMIASIDFNSNSAKALFQGDNQVGYQILLAVILHKDEQSFFTRAKFNRVYDLNDVQLRLQSYAINPQYTYYTFTVRYTFFAIAILACFLYCYRYCKIPHQKRIIEQRLIVVMSVLLIAFNDPLYPLNIFSPNAVSAFFSIVFMLTLIAFLLLFWIVTADRIYFEDGKQQTYQLTAIKIVYSVVVWIGLVASVMVYTMQQITSEPIVTKQFHDRFIRAQIVEGVLVGLGVVYVGYRFIRSCLAEKSRMWRSKLFMTFSTIFIIMTAVVIATNFLIPYNFDGASLILIYGMINTYVYYLQYMFSITDKALQKIKQEEKLSQTVEEKAQVKELNEADKKTDNHIAQKSAEDVENVEQDDYET